MKLNLLFIAFCWCIASAAFGQQVTATVSKTAVKLPPTSSKNKLWAAGGLLNGYNPADEIRGMRTEFSKKFNRADGKIDVIIAGPFHYATEQGALEDIDLNILPATTNEYAYTCDANRFKTAFGGNAAQGVKMVYKSTKIRFGLNPEIKADNWQPAHLLPSSTTVNENAITYENLYDKVKLNYTLSTENLAHTITVADRTVFNGLQADKVAFTEELQFPQNAFLFDNLGLVTPDRPIQGNISIVVNNDTVYTILQPRMWDAAFTDEPFHSQAAYSENTHILFPTTTFENLGEGRYKVVCKVASNWLLDANRGFPLVFDPTVYIGGGGQGSFSNNYRYPFNTCRTSRTSQILFKHSDIGYTGMIDDIGFYQSTSTQYGTNSLQLQIAEVSYDDFTVSTLQTGGFTFLNNYTSSFTTNSSTWWSFGSFNFSHSSALSNLVIQTYVSNTSTSNCTCTNTANGGYWGYYDSAPYNRHRWAFTGGTTTTCSEERNPSFGNLVPATRLTITPTTTACNYSVSPTNITMPYQNGSASFTITTGSSCSFTVTEGSGNASGLIEPNVYSGTGTHTITLNANDVNPLNANRTVTYTVAGTNFLQDVYVTVSPNTTCNPTFSVSSNTVPQSGGTVTIYVNGVGQYCYWDRYYSGISGISLSPYSGYGTGTMTCTIPANTSGSARTLNVYCGQSNSSVSITQAGNCANATTPNANFYASNTQLASGQSTTLYASSACSGCTYNWQIFFNGNVINAVQTQNTSRQFTFDYPGTYGVRLIVSNGCNTGVASVNGYINVSGYTSNSNNSNPPQQTRNPTIVDPRHPKGMAVDPVNLVTGQLEETFKGLSMGVVGGVLSFDLIYNGAATHYTDPITTTNYNGSGIGSNWAHTFDYQIYKLADTIWNVHYPDMHETQFITLYNNGNFRTNSFPLTRGVQDSVKRDPVTREFTMTLKNRALLRFDSSGYLLSITDRNSNAAQVQRNAQHEITAVVGEGGRAFRFTTVNGKITQISAPDNHNLIFTHVGDDLTAFTKPENRTTQIQYIAGTHQIERITKPMGNDLVRNEYTNGKISKQYDGKSYPTQLQYNFPSTGWVTVTYVDNSTRVYKHDETWRVIREWDEEGKSDSTAYGPNNLPLHHLDNKGYPTSFTSDSRTNITDISMPQGRKTHKVFNDKNDIIISVDAKNDTTRYILDGKGNRIKVLFSDGRFVLSHFDAHGQNTANIDALGIQMDSMTYTPQGDLDKRITQKNSYQYAHDSLGRQIAVTDLGMNRTDSTIYNKAGEVIRHRRSDGLVEKMAYNANGLLTQRTNFKGISFTKAYDLNDQLTDTYGPLGFHEKTRYNNRNVKVAFINAKGDSITWVVDKRGFTLQTRLNTNPPAINTLDNEGNVTTVTDPMGVTITSTSDSLYQNTQTNFGGIATTKTDYGASGLVTKTYNANNDYRRFAYSKRGVLDSLYDELGNAIAITRNANLWVTGIKDAEGHHNGTIYDRAGSDSCSTDGSGMQTRVLRNPDATVQQIIRPDNSTISQTYTANGQTATVAYSGGPTYTNTYDPNGNTATIAGPLGTDVFVRDSLDIITSYKDVWNNTILFEKNVIGETKKLTYPNGYQTRTVTNKYGKPDSVILATNKVITYTYDNTGHLLTKNFPNGMRLSILRDGIYRPIGLLYTKQNGAATDTLYYQWCHRSATGDIDTFSVKGSAVLKPTAKSVTKTNTFQPNDAPTSNGTSNFTNNPNGAVTNQTTANGTLQVHSSFVENDLLDTLAGAPTTQKMAWNGLEKLVGITRNGVQTRFVQDCTAPVAKLLQTQTAQGTTTGTYIHDYIGPAAYIDSAGVFSYYAFDLFGNTVFLTNDNGQVVDKYAYDLYCTQVKHIGDSKQLFCGLGQHGALTINDSTLNIQSRFLQTPRNCFMSKDRAVFDNKDPMTLHKYIYANNNTVAYYDLNGWQCTGKSTYDKIIDGVHFGLDVIGTFDPTPISDGINAGIYAGQGDYVNAGISAAGMIPYFGDAGKVAKYGNKAMHLTQDAVKVEKTIWSSGKNLTPIENALSHSNTHREEFEGIFNAKQYVEQAKDFLHNSPTGTLSKIRESDGAIIKYNESTNTFGVMSSDGIPRTFFKPSLEKHNYSTNLNYFLHQ